MSKIPSNLDPWSDESGQLWLKSFECWTKMTRLIKSTLTLEPSEYPHQIRAAAALVILLCRPNLWPGESIQELDEVVDLARRKLVLIKSFFTSEARVKGNLTSDPAFKRLMKSLEQEIRILESRMTDPPMGLPQRAPTTWGDFWRT